MDFRTNRFLIHTLTDSDFTEYTQDRTRVDYISEEDHEDNEGSSSISSSSISPHESSSILRDYHLRQVPLAPASHVDYRKANTSHTEREHAPHPRDEEELRLPFLNVFSEKVLYSQFSELLNMHKEIMLELLNKEEERCLKTLKMVEDVISVSRQNEELKFFNRKLRERAYKR